MDGKNGEGSFKLKTARHSGIRGGYVLEVDSGRKIAAVELMFDLLPLRRSNIFRLAISAGN